MPQKLCMFSWMLCIFVILFYEGWDALKQRGGGCKEVNWLEVPAEGAAVFCPACFYAASDLTGGGGHFRSELCCLPEGRRLIHPLCSILLIKIIKTSHPCFLYEKYDCWEVYCCTGGVICDGMCIFVIVYCQKCSNVVTMFWRWSEWFVQLQQISCFCFVMHWDAKLNYHHWFCLHAVLWIPDIISMLLLWIVNENSVVYLKVTRSEIKTNYYCSTARLLCLVLHSHLLTIHHN